MKDTAKRRLVGTADLTADGERRFLAAALAVGGQVLEPDLGALAVLMADTVELLYQIDEAILPPILHDKVSA